MLYGLFDTSLTYVWNADAQGKNLVGLGNGTCSATASA
jgi:hypothetical protein